MKEFIQRNKALVGAGSAVGVLVLAFLAFGVFGIHTAFIDSEVSESGPVFASGASADVTVSQDEASQDEGSQDQADSDAEGDTESTESSDATETTEAPAAEEASTPEIVTAATGSFTDSPIHAGSGDANILTDGTQTFLRFEDNFATDNGPDLNVYLRANDGSGEFLDLGDLKGNIGAQNYEVPAGTDLSRFTDIDIWCVRFGVSFATASLG